MAETLSTGMFEEAVGARLAKNFHDKIKQHDKMTDERERRKDVPERHQKQVLKQYYIYHLQIYKFIRISAILYGHT